MKKDLLAAIREGDLDQFIMLVNCYQYRLYYGNFSELVKEIYNNGKDERFIHYLNQKNIIHLDLIIRYIEMEHKNETMEWFLNNIKNYLNASEMEKIGYSLIKENVPEKIIYHFLGNNFCIEKDIFENDQYILLDDDRFKMIVDHSSETVLQSILEKCIMTGEMDKIKFLIENNYPINHHIVIDKIFDQSEKLSTCDRCEAYSFSEVYHLMKTLNQLHKLGFIFHVNDKNNDNLRSIQQTVEWYNQLTFD